MEVVPYILISKYLSQEATESEIEILNNWRAESPLNEEEFQNLKEVWLLSHWDKTDFVYPDKEKVWNRLASRIQLPTKTYAKSFLIRVASIAAVVSLLIGFSFSQFFIGKQGIPTQEIFVKTPNGQKSEVLLPDGTIIWLNAGSTISYFSDYNIKNRTVKLRGEAFFDVAKDKSLAFNVISGDVKVVVYGTSFNVSAYDDDSTIDVALEEGRVNVETLSASKLLASLSPNEMASIDKRTMASEVILCDAGLESIWRHNCLKIENEQIELAVRKIERWYGVNIHLSGDSSPDNYWLTIETESLTETLELINKITPINYTIKGEEVHITYK